MQRTWWNNPSQKRAPRTMRVKNRKSKRQKEQSEGLPRRHAGPESGLLPGSVEDIRGYQKPGKDRDG
jgi:hypothetical protein